MKKLMLFLTTIVVCFNHAYAAPPTRTFTYADGEIINATKVTTNEQNVYQYLSTGVDTLATNTVETADIQAGAVTSEKILDGTIVSADIADGTIVNADISTSAAIADTKLANITTAGKVNGTALVGLNQTPQSAGLIPLENLGSGTTGATVFLRGDATWNSIIQVANNSIATVVDVDAFFPQDDTLPQNTEGDQIVTCTITPTNANSTLVITANAWGSIDSGGLAGQLALFQDTNADALAFTANRVGASSECSLTLHYTCLANTTSSTTFKLRGGCRQGGHWYINGGTGGTRLYGGASAAYLTITEIP